MKKACFILFSIVAMCAPAFAASAVGPDFLMVNPAARPAGMGNAFAAIADDVNAAAFNPSGLALQKEIALSISHFFSVSDTHYEYVGFVYPSQGQGTAGISVTLSYTLGVEDYDETGTLTGAVTNYDFLLSTSYAYPVFQNLYAGANLKYFYSKLDEYSKKGFAIDIGGLIIFQTTPRTTFGAVLQNLGTQDAYIEEVEEMPLNLKAGFAVFFTVLSKDDLKVDIDFNKLVRRPDDPALSAGIEARVMETLYLRAGYESLYDEGNFFFGLGLEAKKLRFSYAYQPFGDFGSLHRISLDAGFGPGQ